MNQSDTPGDGGSPQRGGHGRRRRHHGRGQVGFKVQSTPRFQGREPTLTGHIYDLTSVKSCEHYLKTTKEITNMIRRKCTKHTAVFVQVVENLDLSMPTAPADPPIGDSLVLERWKIQIKHYEDQWDTNRDFLANLYNLVIGQCTETLEDKIKSHGDFAAANQNGILLLQIIKSMTYSFEDCHKLSNVLSEVMESFYCMRQGENESQQDYHECFNSHVAMMEEVGAAIASESLISEVSTLNG